MLVFKRFGAPATSGAIQLAAAVRQRQRFAKCLRRLRRLAPIGNPASGQMKYSCARARPHFCLDHLGQASKSNWPHFSANADALRPNGIAPIVACAHASSSAPITKLSCNSNNNRAPSAKRGPCMCARALGPLVARHFKLVSVREFDFGQKPAKIETSL